MTNLRLYDGSFEAGAIMRRREWREAAAEQLQDKLDREYTTTFMTRDEYDSRCAEITAFVETDCDILPVGIVVQLQGVIQ